MAEGDGTPLYHELPEGFEILVDASGTATDESISNDVLMEVEYDTIMFSTRGVDFESHSPVPYRVLTTTQYDIVLHNGLFGNGALYESASPPTTVPSTTVTSTMASSTTTQRLFRRGDSSRTSSSLANTILRTQPLNSVTGLLQPIRTSRRRLTGPRDVTKPYLDILDGYEVRGFRLSSTRLSKSWGRSKKELHSDQHHVHVLKPTVLSYASSVPFLGVISIGKYAPNEQIEGREDYLKFWFEKEYHQRTSILPPPISTSVSRTPQLTSGGASSFRDPTKILPSGYSRCSSQTDTTTKAHARNLTENKNGADICKWSGFSLQWRLGKLVANACMFTKALPVEVIGTSWKSSDVPVWAIMLETETVRRSMATVVVKLVSTKACVDYWMRDSYTEWRGSLDNEKSRGILEAFENEPVSSLEDAWLLKHPKSVPVHVPYMLRAYAPYQANTDRVASISNFKDLHCHFQPDSAWRKFCKFDYLEEALLRSCHDVRFHSDCDVPTRPFQRLRVDLIEFGDKELLWETQTTHTAPHADILIAEEVEDKDAVIGLTHLTKSERIVETFIEQGLEEEFLRQFIAPVYGYLSFYHQPLNTTKRSTEWRG
ncbi:hypothetical protein BU23DRAFT_657305 [Bimuria novae-zelandiae CBS 107.79]|uniref:Uncharacterized protein n=1 Tax=Bimuria novae-zelandiae CBS 107.79 TaxID=1447943 RepID=A0A6A5VXC3_9PLEO|nr:hypothetical protein BU23DRAFT_657305 [Bimuria novae-zelandiae CBS 107.79]